MMLWMLRRVPCDQRLDRRAADREKADQMFRRGQHVDVLDAFVVGLAGFFDARIPAVAGRGSVRAHGFGSLLE
jgi:hypothetical protein